VVEDLYGYPNLLAVLSDCPIVNGEVDPSNLAGCLACSVYEADRDSWNVDTNTKCTSCSVCGNGNLDIVCTNTLDDVLCGCDGECLTGVPSPSSPTPAPVSLPIGISPSIPVTPVTSADNRLCAYVDGIGSCIEEDVYGQPNLLSVALNCPVVIDEVDTTRLGECQMCFVLEVDSLSTWDGDADSTNSCSTCSVCEDGNLSFDCTNTIDNVSCDCSGQCTPGSGGAPTIPAPSPSQPSSPTSPFVSSLLCSVDADGIGACSVPDLYGNGLSALATDCPIDNGVVDSSRFAECGSCTVAPTLYADAIGDAATPVCSSCSVCPNGGLYFDCGNVIPAVVCDCEGACIDAPDRQPAAPAAAPSSRPSPSPDAASSTDTGPTSSADGESPAESAAVTQSNLRGRWMPALAVVAFLFV